MADVSSLNGYDLKDAQARSDISELKSGEVYSTNETLTNKVWIDGKEIYRKTIIIPQSSITTGEHSYAHGISNVDKIWFDLSNSFLEESAYNAFWNLMAINDANSTSTYKITNVWVDATTMSLNVGAQIFARMTSTDNLYVTVNYTKTTD